MISFWKKKQNVEVNEYMHLERCDRKCEDYRHKAWVQEGLNEKIFTSRDLTRVLVW